MPLHNEWLFQETLKGIIEVVIAYSLYVTRSGNMQSHFNDMLWWEKFSLVKIVDLYFRSIYINSVKNETLSIIFYFRKKYKKKLWNASYD